MARAHACVHMCVCIGVFAITLALVHRAATYYIVHVHNYDTFVGMGEGLVLVNIHHSVSIVF